MTDAELIEMLRANASWGDDRFTEAADRIEALTEKNQSLALDHLAALGQAAEQIEALTAERDRLREALRFYAEGQWPEDYPGGVLYNMGHKTCIDYGNRARAALNNGKADT